MYIPLESLPGPLDLQLYLKRIGAAQVGLPPALHLDHLHQRHLLSVPFDTFSDRVGGSRESDLPLLFAKIVCHRRGGDSFELSTLFAWLLRELHFTVEYRIARIVADLGGPSPGPAMVLVVEIDGESWLVDVGCASGIVTPIRLQAGEIATTREGEISIEAAGNGEFAIDQVRSGNVRRVLMIEGQPADEARCAAVRLEAHEVVQQKGPEAAILTESGFARLSGGVLRLPRQGRDADVKQLAPEKIPYFLEHLFEIETPDAGWGMREI